MLPKHLIAKRANHCTMLKGCLYYRCPFFFSKMRTTIKRYRHFYTLVLSAPCTYSGFSPLNLPSCPYIKAQYEIVRIISAFSKFVKRICVLPVCYVCATVKNPLLFSKILENADIRKAPKTLGFKDFPKILIKLQIISC